MRSTIDLVRATSKIIEEEAKNKKGRTVYDILEFKHFPTLDQLIQSDMSSIRKYGKKNFQECRLNLTKNITFQKFFEENEEDCLNILTNKNILIGFRDLFLAYVLALNDCIDPVARCNYATLILLEKQIKKPIEHFAINETHPSSYEFFMIGKPSSFEKEKKISIDELSKLGSTTDEYVIFDPTLYLVCAPSEYPRLLKEKFPEMNTITLLNRTEPRQRFYENAASIMKLSSTYIQEELSKLGYNFDAFSIKNHFTSTQTMQLLSSKDSNIIEERKSLIASVKKYESEFKPFTKHFTLDIQPNKRLEKEYHECQQALEKLRALQNKWFAESLKILNKETISSNNSKKIKKFFFDEYKAFIHRISSLSTIEEINKENTKLIALEKLLKKMALQDSTQKYQQQIENYKKLDKQNTLEKSSVDLSSIVLPPIDYSKKFNEKKAAFQTLCEDYQKNKEKLQEAYDSMNSLYKSIYGKDYNAPSSLEQKLNIGGMLTEVNADAASAENIEKIEKYLTKVSAAKDIIDKDIVILNGLKMKYEHKKNGSKDKISVAPHAGTFASQKSKVKAEPVQTKVRAHRRH